MVFWTIVAWIVDTCALLQLAHAIQYRMRVLPDQGWHGMPWMIGFAALIVVSIIVSVVLVLSSGARGVRVAALVVAGGLPAAVGFAMFVMLLGAIGVALSGGRFN